MLYRIHASQMDRLQEKIEKLNRRADKLDTPFKIDFFPVHLDKEEHGREVDFFWTVWVRGESPRLNGWELVSVIEHVGTEDGYQNVVKNVPGSGYDATADRNSEPTCDHCQTNRFRKETFVVRHDEDGSLRRVGRQCLRDFLGHRSPAQLAEWSQWAYFPEEMEHFGVRYERTLDPRQFLAYTSAAIRNCGWVSKSKAYYEGGNATVNVVLFSMFPPNSVDLRREVEDRRAALPDAEDFETADKVLDWVSNEIGSKETKTDYEHNLVVALSIGWLVDSTSGIAASAVASYKRHVEKIILAERRKKEAANSEHFGTVKKREEFVLTITKVMEFESQWGLSILHRMIDASGNIAIWWCSNEVNVLEQGKTYRVMATVKRHDDYKGTPQTTLTRLTMIEEIENGGERAA